MLITIKNEKNRQTYYGALDDETHKFIVKEYSSGNTANTVHFIQYFQNKIPGKRWGLFWHGASYHQSQEFKEYLKQVNGDLPEE